MHWKRAACCWPCLPAIDGIFVLIAVATYAADGVLACMRAQAEEFYGSIPHVHPFLGSIPDLMLPSIPDLGELFHPSIPKVYPSIPMYTLPPKPTFSIPEFMLPSIPMKTYAYGSIVEALHPSIPMYTLAPKPEFVVPSIPMHTLPPKPEYVVPSIPVYTLPPKPEISVPSIPIYTHAPIAYPPIPMFAHPPLVEVSVPIPYLKPSIAEVSVPIPGIDLAPKPSWVGGYLPKIFQQQPATESTLGQPAIPGLPSALELISRTNAGVAQLQSLLKLNTPQEGSK